MPFNAYVLVLHPCRDEVMPSAYAVVVGIEKYFASNISEVRYARDDAKAFKELLIGILGVPTANVTLLLDEEAHKLNIEDNLKQALFGLEEGDRFYFFHAGHGLWSNGSNRLTAWDTQPVNLDGTTVDLENSLLKPLRESACKESAIFIDACASEFKGTGATSSIVCACSSTTAIRRFHASASHAPRWRQMFTLNSTKISKIVSLITTNVCELSFALPKM